MLLPYYIKGAIEAGCDEAGRGPLAGSVFAAAVILPDGFADTRLNDSKQLSEPVREELRELIQKEAICWAVAEATPAEIDEHNILNASILAMHRALSELTIQPQHIIVDGNRFRPYISAATGLAIPHLTIVKGDGKYMSIAAASILAKTYRDDYMRRLAEQYPDYGWERNMGYPTAEHRRAILQHGLTPYHRRSFTFKTNDL